MRPAPSVEPSVDWRERIAPDEDERFARQAEQIVEVQQAMNDKFGVGRTLHRKQRIGVRGTIDIFGDLPQYAAHGLFARSGPHDVLVRMSNGGIHRAKDSTPDIRGFAIKVLDINGPGALGVDTTSQDFLLINHSTFSLPTSTAFVDLVASSARGRGALIGHAIRTNGLLGGLRMLRSFASVLSVPFTGFATERFWSALPIANGPFAARVRLVPVDPAPASGGSDWAADLTSRLAAGPLIYDLQLQFFTDEATTPIEDPAIDWPSPYVTVARLTIPRQDATSAEGQAVQAEVEASAFDPWSALVEHRPLGEIMRSRRKAYRASQLGRGLS